MIHSVRLEAVERMSPTDIALAVPQLEAALAEDLGTGDITSRLAVVPEALGMGRYVAKEDLVCCGLPVAREVNRLVDPELEFRECVEDGDDVPIGAVLAWVKGSARSILAAERTSLNILQRMSGIATLTRRYVAVVEGTQASILDTRKTVPGLRRLDKHAVAGGGGINHRFGLFDGVLIKNNHLVFHSGVGDALRRVKGQAEGVPIQVEVQDLTELEEALSNGADAVLLDNFTPEEARQAVGRVERRVPVEVSGGITLSNVRDFAEAGVDRISIGALTHSVRAVDIHLQLTPL